MKAVLGGDGNKPPSKKKCDRVKVRRGFECAQSNFFFKAPTLMYKALRWVKQISGSMSESMKIFNFLMTNISMFIHWF